MTASLWLLWEPPAAVSYTHLGWETDCLLCGRGSRLPAGAGVLRPAGKAAYAGRVQDVYKRQVLTSPQLTAQWETELTAIAKGQADPEGFMAGIAEMTRGLIAN